MAKFRKKPVVIEAIQYKPHENCAEVAAFLGQAYNKLACDSAQLSADWIIMTLEGEMTCRSGDWIIKGVKGEVYPCKDEIFRETYEPADAAPITKHIEQIPMGPIGATLDAALRSATPSSSSQQYVQDAERYRLLRSASYVKAQHFIRWTGGEPWLIAEDELDAECDAEIAASQEQGGE